ncbi:MAG: ABC transporter permease subunit [Clostridia bacterium]|nr:ABC transporter permease subunit [Clostridia bacterium]
MKTRQNKENVRQLGGEQSFINHFKNHYMLYLFLAPAVLLVFIFSYLPMTGLVIAFQDFDVFKGLFGSEWVGFENIRSIFETPMFLRSISNTLQLSVLTLLVSFPFPVIFALLLNEIKVSFFKRTFQTISYLPYFLSWIAVVGLTYSMTSVYGVINDIMEMICGNGYERVMFLSKQELFVPMVLFLSVWKSFGWDSIIYLSAITSIDQQLYEAAEVDGANKWQQTIHVTLPGIIPTAVIVLIFNLGNLFKSNFELIYGLQNPFIDYDVISTVIYKSGIQNGDYAMSTAMGFIEGIVAFVLVLMANKISKKASGTALW